MQSIGEVEKVVAIMMAFRGKRLRWMMDHKGKDTDDCPASMSREVEALTIIKLIREGKDYTQEMIGHHPPSTPVR